MTLIGINTSENFKGTIIQIRIKAFERQTDYYYTTTQEKSNIYFNTNTQIKRESI
jgi:hypothetical protein